MQHDSILGHRSLSSGANNTSRPFMWWTISTLKLSCARV